MVKNTSLLILFILLISSHVQAQKYLLLKKIGSKKRFEYFVGDPIKLKIRSTNKVIKDDIKDLKFRDSLIVFQDTSIHLKDVKTLYTSNISKGFLDRTGNFLILVGLVYLIADTGNSAINGDQLFVDSVLKRSGYLVAGGVVLKLLKKRRFRPRPGGNTRLLIIDI